MAVVGSEHMLGTLLLAPGSEPSCTGLLDGILLKAHLFKLCHLHILVQALSICPRFSWTHATLMIIRTQCMQAALGHRRTASFCFDKALALFPDGPQG